MTLADAYGAFAVVGIVSVSTILAELFSYILVYNTEDYVRACDRVRELNKKLDKEDRKIVSVEKRKSHEKAVDRLEEELKQASQKMDGLKLRSNILVGVAFLFLYRMVAAAWTGHVVARLPFLPIKLIQPLSFRGLKGDDYYQCSFGFIYTLSTMGIKANIPRLLGFSPPKSRMDATRMAAKQQRKSNTE
ncbi:unnamed protein product [Agarophyton chilense]